MGTLFEMSEVHYYGGGGETSGMTGTSKGSTGAITDERAMETPEEREERLAAEKETAHPDDGDGTS